MIKRILYYAIFLVGFLFIAGARVVQAVSLPDFSKTSDLPAFISSVYSFALTVVGIAVFIRILYAGFLMLTAAGNSSKWGDARTKMQNAVIGAILLFAAYMILYIINPDLVSNTFKFTIPSSSQPSSNIPTESQRTNATNGAAATTGIVPAAGGATSFHGLPIAKAQEGMYVFTVKVTDRNGDTCSESYNIEVLPNTVALSSDFYAKHSAVGKYSASLLNPVRESLGLKRKLGTIGISNGVNAVNAQEESESETTETIQSGGCVIGTRVLPDAVENTPYYAEIVAAGEAPFVYEIEEGSLPPGLGLVAALDMPVLTIENLTAQRTPAYSFNQTDRFRLTLTNAKPNSKVFFKWIKNGQPWFWSNIKPTTGGWTEYGVTDQDGKWVNEAAYSPEYVGVWQIYAMVDGKISKAIEIQVVAPEVEIATAPPSSLPSAYYNPYAFSSCVNTTHCENTETGETSPLNEIVGGGVGSCDEDERIVWECTYPWDENDPNDR